MPKRRGNKCSTGGVANPVVSLSPFNGSYKKISMFQSLSKPNLDDRLPRYTKVGGLTVDVASVGT